MIASKTCYSHGRLLIRKESQCKQAATFFKYETQFWSLSPKQAPAGCYFNGFTVNINYQMDSTNSATEATERMMSLCGGASSVPLPMPLHAHTRTHPLVVVPPFLLDGKLVVFWRTAIESGYI